jgi:3-hydroxybutyryl-CoA dehydrogenase
VAREFRTVGVVGLGTMGAGIAEVFARNGLQVVAAEVDEEAVARGRAHLETSTNRAIERGKLTEADAAALLDRITTTTSITDLADADLVVEAVPEHMDLKAQVFAELDKVCRPEVILASNTSSLSVTELSVRTGRPGKVVGMHFFNPAPVLPLVEVIRTAHTSDATFEAAYAFAQRIGKEPVACNDTPGFIVNRILIPLLNDCVRVLDEARVSPDDVDRAMRFGANWPIGPCALIDLIGVDVHVHASEALHGALGEDRMAPPRRLLEMQEQGHLGRKTGRGFYEY